MKIYTIHSAATAIPEGEVLNPSAWAQAEVARIDRFPWYTAGVKQATEVRVLAAEDALHVLFVAEDRHSSAEARALHGPVCLDSCVEFFAGPWPQDTPDYFNLEINCGGGVHLGFGPERHHRRLATSEQVGRLTVVPSCRGPTKQESPDDREWRLYARVPRELLCDFCGREVRFEGEWRANFFRCGGKTDQQYGTWNPVGTAKPDYHRPEHFGLLRFD